MTEPERTDRLLEVIHVAKRLNTCDETVRRYSRAGLWKAERMPGGARNRPWRIRESEVAALLKRGFDAVRYQADEYAARFVDRCGVYFVAGADLVKIGLARNILARLACL